MINLKIKKDTADLTDEECVRINTEAGKVADVQIQKEGK